jgi:hypothetical protein
MVMTLAAAIVLDAAGEALDGSAVAMTDPE